MKKIIAIIIILIILLTTTAFADSLIEVDILLNADITIKSDTVLFKATDVNGNIVLPISYNGTTYLPIRSISELFGKEVIWNDDTKTIIIDDGNLTLNKTIKENNNLVNEYVKAFINKKIKIVVNGSLVTMEDANGNIVLPISYNGTTYIPVRSISELYHKDIDWDGDSNIIYIGVKPDIYTGEEISFIDAYKNEDILFNGYSVEDNPLTWGGGVYIKQGIGYINADDKESDYYHDFYKNLIAINNEDLKGNTIKLTLNSKFNNMYFYFDSSQHNMIDINMDIYYDGIYQNTITSKPYYYVENGYQKNNYELQFKTLDISGVNEIEFIPNWSGREGGNNYVDYSLCNIKFK